MIIGYLIYFRNIILSLTAWWMQKNPTESIEWADYFVRVLRHQTTHPAWWMQLNPTELTEWVDYFVRVLRRQATQPRACGGFRIPTKTSFEDELGELIQHRGAPNPVQSSPVQSSLRRLQNTPDSLRRLQNTLESLRRLQNT